MTGKRAISAALVAGAAILLSAGPARAVTFIAPELLGRPTDTSITVHAMADVVLDVYFEYGASPGIYTGQTAVAAYPAGGTIAATLDGLLPDTRYYYRMRYREAGGTSFAARPEHTFHTQRAAHGAFVFTVQSDSHIYDRKGDHALYTIAQQNQLADSPDFMVDLGDTFGDDRNGNTMTYAQEDQLHLDQRPFMSIVGGSAPVFLGLGNHEGEAGFYLRVTPPDNLAIYATLARQKYFPNPVPDGFYSGNGASEGYGVGLPQNYYAWQWGDALFVVLDAYRYNVIDPKVSGDLWDWTLGRAQYDWLEATLQASQARYKFVFAHHVLGQTRGGVAWADRYEWGGKNKNGSYGFDAHRPGWVTPIHQLMAQNGVTIFFQGHDHLYAREELDGVVYQEVPMPSDATYHVGDVNADAYAGVVLNNSGHLRVTVSPAQVTVDYVRAYLPGDGPNGEVAHSYTIARVSSPAPPPVADGKLAGAAARFGRSPTDPAWIDVSYDASSCAAQRAIVLYGELGDFSTYQGCASSDAGNSGTASFDASALQSVWFNIVWVDGSTAGHPGYGSMGTAVVERTWAAAGFCGVAADDHGHDNCP